MFGLIPSSLAIRLFPQPSDDNCKILSTTLGGSIGCLLSPVKTAEILSVCMLTLTLSVGGGSILNVVKGSVYAVARHSGKFLRTKGLLRNPRTFGIKFMGLAPRLPDGLSETN